jgi:hypothetical protein
VRQAGQPGLPTLIDTEHAEDFEKTLNWLALFLF